MPRTAAGSATVRVRARDREDGLAAFLVRYLGDYVRLRLRGYSHQAAYRRIPAEVSAEWRARRGLHLGCD